MASNPHISVKTKGFRALSSLMEEIGEAAYKDVNHIIASAAFDSRKLAQAAVNRRIENDVKQTKSAVYYRVQKGRKGQPYRAYIRISQRKWNWIRFALEGGSRFAGAHVKGNYIGVPEGGRGTSKKLRSRLYRFARQVKPSAGVFTSDDAPGERRRFKAVPMRKSPKDRVAFIEVMRNGSPHYYTEGWLKQQTNYPVKSPDIRTVFNLIVDRMVAKNARRVFGTEIRKAVRRNARKG